MGERLIILVPLCPFFTNFHSLKYICYKKIISVFDQLIELVIKQHYLTCQTPKDSSVRVRTLCAKYQSAQGSALLQATFVRGHGGPMVLILNLKWSSTKYR